MVDDFILSKLLSARRRFFLSAVRASYALNQKFLSNAIYKSLEKSKKNLLINGSEFWFLGKEGLNEDIFEILGGISECSLMRLDRKIPKYLASKILSNEISDNNYGMSSTILDHQKETYRHLWCKIFDEIPTPRRPKAIFTGNFGYYAEREVAAAAELKGIPFFAMHKECLKSDDRVKFFEHVYRRRGTFAGRRIFVYNQREKELQVAAGVADRARISVCGMPRLDRVHKWRRCRDGQILDHNVMLVFGFSRYQGLPRIPQKTRSSDDVSFEYLSEEDKGLNWGSFFEKYHETIVKLACENEDKKIIFKLKGGARDCMDSLEMLQRLRAPANIQIVVGGDTFSYITKASVVCGFNSTAILEAVAAGVPVVGPVFDEALSDHLRGYSVDFTDPVYRPESPEDMFDVLHSIWNSAHKMHRMLASGAEDLLYNWVGNPDGCSSDRVREVFLRETQRC